MGGHLHTPYPRGPSHRAPSRPSTAQHDTWTVQVPPEGFQLCMACQWCLVMQRRHLACVPRPHAAALAAQIHADYLASFQRMQNQFGNGVTDGINTYDPTYAAAQDLRLRHGAELRWASAMLLLEDRWALLGSMPEAGVLQDL